MSKDASHPLDVAQLPDDPALLKQLWIEREQQWSVQLQEREALLAKVRQEAERQRATELAALRQQLQAKIDALLQRLYGPKRERFDPRQLLLFGLRAEELAEQQPEAAEFDLEPELTPRRKPKKEKQRHEHGRGPLPAHLPRIPIEHDLTEAEKPCPCCGELRERIGQEVSEQLELVPATFQVLQHIQYKYACRACETRAEPPQIQMADKPPQPIDKGLPGPGLLAYIATSKWNDHLPLYRLESIFSRLQIHIARSTMCNWMAAMGELVRPLVELMIQRIRQSQVVHTDDTTVPVLDKQSCRKGRLWVYLGDCAHPYIVYDYTATRKRDGPMNWLRDYRGYLQADAYGGYDGIYHSGAIEVACWAHARRKFYEARSTDRQRAVQMLTQIGKLYRLEDDLRTLTDDERRAARQAQATPVLHEIKTWLDTEREIVLPKSPMGEAIGYTLNQWNALNTYTTQGYLSIDNNAAERALKRVAIGRKNWLFAGNDRAGGTAARLYSLLASAQRHELDPQRYLTSLFARLPSTPESQLPQLLPDRWKLADQAELSHPAESSPPPSAP